MKWLHFILSHSIFIAFCASALVFQSNQLLHLPHNSFIYGFVFFATLSSYNFYWILSKIAFVEEKRALAVLQKETTSLMILMISSAGFIYCFYWSGISFEYVLTAVALTVVYSIPLLPFKITRFARRAGVLKTILLAFTWSYATAFIPLQKAYWLLDSADVFVITRRFLFMLMLCIIFDNRDKAIDKMRGLHSLATDLKPVLLKTIIYLVFAVLFISNLYFKEYDISWKQSLALQVSTLALLGVYFYSAKKRSYLFYYFIVDGLMLFSALATGIAGI